MDNKQKELELKAQIFDLLYLIEQSTTRKDGLVRELAKLQNIIAQENTSKNMEKALNKEKGESK